MSAKHFNSYGYPAPTPKYPRESTLFTTGAIWRNPNTDVVIVTLLNEDYNMPQTVTVSVLDWQNTCNPAEVAKSAYLCGQVVNPTLNTTQTIQPQQGNNVQPILTPFTFTIPPRNLLVIHAVLPNSFQQPSPCYEVLVTSQHGPAKSVITNTFGVNTAGVPQEGNTVCMINFHLLLSPHMASHIILSLRLALSRHKEYIIHNLEDTSKKPLQFIH